MPLLYNFHKTLGVFKTGSPSVRFYYLLTVCCGSCISGVVARHDIGKFIGLVALSIFGCTCPYPPLHSLDSLEFHISLPLS